MRPQAGLFRLIPAYSGLFVNAAQALGFGGQRHTLLQKSDPPPDYSVSGESTLGTLVIGGEPLVES